MQAIRTMVQLSYHIKYVNHLSNIPLEGPRLVGGKTTFGGRLEYLHDGEWGRVFIDMHWDRNDAEVACHELGSDGIEQVKLTKVDFYWLSHLGLGGILPNTFLPPFQTKKQYFRLPMLATATAT